MGPAVAERVVAVVGAKPAVRVAAADQVLHCDVGHIADLQRLVDGGGGDDLFLTKQTLLGIHSPSCAPCMLHASA